jgi:hypothetical protein
LAYLLDINGELGIWGISLSVILSNTKDKPARTEVGSYRLGCEGIFMPFAADKVVVCGNLWSVITSTWEPGQVPLSLSPTPPLLLFIKVGSFAEPGGRREVLNVYLCVLF